jgi:hypothetical protein
VGGRGGKGWEKAGTEKAMENGNVLPYVKVTSQRAEGNGIWAYRVQD